MSKYIFVTGGIVSSVGKGLIASGLSPDDRLVEIVEVKDHPYMIACQFRAEFKSRPNRPHPLFVEFIAAAKKTMVDGTQVTLPLGQSD